MLVGDGGSKHDPTDEIVGNPIHAFNLVKRFVVDWKKIENDLSKDDCKETAFKIKKRRLKTVLPKEDDLHQSAQVILTKPIFIVHSYRSSRGIFKWAVKKRRHHMGLGLSYIFIDFGISVQC